MNRVDPGVGVDVDDWMACDELDVVRLLDELLISLIVFVDAERALEEVEAGR